MDSGLIKLGYAVDIIEITIEPTGTSQNICSLFMSQKIKTRQTIPKYALKIGIALDNGSSRLADDLIPITQEIARSNVIPQPAQPMILVIIYTYSRSRKIVKRHCCKFCPTHSSSYKELAISDTIPPALRCSYDKYTGQQYLVFVWPGFLSLLPYSA